MQLALEIQRGRDKPAPLYRQIADQVQSLIEHREIAAGARLPTVRALAESLEVTAVTVQGAYNELRERGLVEAVVGRGTFVLHNELRTPESFFPAAGSTQDVIRDMTRIERMPGILPMAQGNGSPELRPAAEFMRCLRSLEAEAESLLGYWSSQGCATLRGEIAGLLAARGINGRHSQMLLTQGVTQGLDLLVQTLCEAGDTVLVESPTYLGLLGILEYRGVQPIGIPLADDGIDLDALERTLRRERPRFLYLVGSFNNPTGKCMSLERRHALLRLAESYGLMIVEDDIYRDVALTEEPPPPLKALDRSDLVIYIDGFSKSLMPGLRIGYVLPPEGLRRRLVDLHQLRTLSGPTLIQAALGVFLRRGGLQEHLARSLPVYRARRRVLLDELDRRMPPGAKWSRPDGGFCVWLTLPDNPGAAHAHRAMVANGVAVAPGDRFLPRPDGRQHVRLSYGSIPERDIPEAVRRIAAAIGSSTGPPAAEVLNETVPLV